MDQSSPIEWLSAAVIEIPLRNMAGTNADISSEWPAEQFKIGQGDGLETWRINCTMSVEGDTQPWSLVVKGWRCGDRSGAPSSFNWPWREADLYSSGLLDNLSGVSTPACFHSVEREDSVWVWLEDLTGISQDRRIANHAYNT